MISCGFCASVELLLQNPRGARHEGWRQRLMQTLLSQSLFKALSLKIGHVVWEEAQRMRGTHRLEQSWEWMKVRFCGGNEMGVWGRSETCF